MTSRLLKPGVATVMTGAKMWATVGDKVDAGGPYQAPNLEDPVQLNGTVRFEADPNPSILWEIESGPGGGLFEPSANVEDPTFLPDAYGTYILKLTGDPTPGAPLSDTATMVVYDAPIVDAGGPYTGTVSTPIQLNGTIVAGSDPTPAAKWLIVSGGTGTFSDTGIEDPTFTPDQEGEYVLRLEAATIDAPLQSDTAGLSSQPVGGALFSVDLQVTIAPEIFAGSPIATFVRNGINTLSDYKGTIREVAAAVPVFFGARLDPDNITYHSTRDDGTTPIDASDFFADNSGPFGYLGESEVLNSLRQTENMDIAPWNDKAINVIANDAAAPDLSVTAEKIVEDLTNASHGARQDVTGLLDNTLYTETMFVKAAGRSKGSLQMRLKDSSTTDRIDFDLVAKTIGAGGIITELGNGWFAVAAEFNILSGGTIPRALFYLLADDGTFTYVGDGVSGMYMWGGSLKTDGPSTYVSTTNVADSKPANYLSYETAGNLPANSVAISFQFIPLASIVNGPAKVLFESYVDANNYTAILLDSGNIVFRKVTAGVTQDAAAPIVLVQQGVFTIAATQDPAAGMSVAINGGIPGTNADTGDLQLATDFFIGPRTGTEDHAFCSIRFFAVGPSP